MQRCQLIHELYQLISILNKSKLLIKVRKWEKSKIFLFTKMTESYLSLDLNDSSFNKCYFYYSFGGYFTHDSDLHKI